MDVVFDIDGTLADASHRLHFINDMAYWDTSKLPPRPNWTEFLKDEQVSKDAPIIQTWHVLEALLDAPGTRVIFITGRSETTRHMTISWLTDAHCPYRSGPAWYWEERRESGGISGPVVYMRKEGDRRPSEEAKRDALNRARADGYNPKLVFEDRKTDTAMWREEGLLCCQVAVGDY